jgi:hypothetical protein
MESVKNIFEKFYQTNKGFSNMRALLFMKLHLHNPKKFNAE